MYVYSGIALRIAQSLGIHRDGELTNTLSPIAIEIRRRVYWELRMLDLACAEDCGFLPTHIYGADTKLPLNINDEDLTSNLLTENEGVTDMTYCLIRVRFPFPFSPPVKDKRRKLIGKVRELQPSPRPHQHPSWLPALHRSPHIFP